MSQNGKFFVSNIESKKMNIEAFKRNIVPIRQLLVTRARSMTGDDSQAEDLVQEVMLKMWDRRTEVANHPNPTALAMTMLKNKAHDQWRQQQIRTNTSRAAEHGIEDNRAEARSDMELIRQIVNRLPPLQQKIFRMKEIEGYEAQEIISITGCSPEALRQNLSRARRTIREEFVKLSNDKRI